MNPAPASALILVHTGTGNSLRVGQWLQEDLLMAGCTGELVQIAAGQTAPAPPTAADAVLVLIFPTHGFTAPWSVLRHVWSLPRRRGVMALPLATRGGTRWGRFLAPGAEGTAAMLVAVLLAWKGYRICGWRGIDMPSNWTALHSALGARSVEALRGLARRQVADVAGRLAAGRVVMGIGTIVQALIGLALLPLSLAYLLIGRQFLAKLFMASEACDGCGVCRDRCPHAAIRWFRQRPYWTLACESCMRCMAVCPRRAVQATQALGGVYLGLGVMVTAMVTAGLIGSWPAVEPWLGSDLPMFLLHALVLAAVLVVTYALAWLLGRTPILGWLVHGLTLTRWYRRHRDPEVPVAQLLPAAPR